MKYFILKQVNILKTLFVKSAFFLSLTLFGSIGMAKQYMPADMAFKPSIQGNLITISIAEGHYLYQDRISVLAQNKMVKFTFLNKPIVKKFPNQGSYVVYLGKAQLKIPSGLKQPITLRYQGCSSLGLCYPPQQVTLKAQ